MNVVMQDRYAGDVGDFMKLGLLRWLVAPTPFAPQRQLGVIWYRVPDESHNGDGKHIGYLDPSSTAGQDLRPLDADLYDRLRDMVAADNRSVAALAAGGVLPSSTRYYDRVLDFSDLDPSDRAARAVRRERWFHEAMVAVAPCSLVFLDPDNGLRRDDHPVPAHRNLAEKHVYLSEAQRLLDRGQSVVVYHHADRSERVPDQAQSRMEDIRDELGVDPVAAVQASRGSARLFLVIPSNDHHRSELDDRLAALQLSNWGDELRVHRWQRVDAGSLA
jgi:hypothetical protein